MQHGALLPRQPGGLAPGAALSLLAHGGLLVALTLSVDWRADTPDVVSAELWSSLPQVAAPQAQPAPVPAPAPPAPPTPPAQRPPPPAPAPRPPTPAQTPAPPAAKPAPQQRDATPPEPQISTARAERRKQEREQQAAAAAVQTAAAQKQRSAEARQAEEARLRKLRDDQLQRMMSTLPSASTPATGSAAQTSAISQSYAARLKARIGKPTSLFADSIAGNPAAEVEVTSGATGTIIARRLTKPSGDKDWDEAVLRQIDRAGSLPPDVDGRVPSPIVMTFRPKE